MYLAFNLIPNIGQRSLSRPNCYPSRAKLLNILLSLDPAFPPRDCRLEKSPAEKCRLEIGSNGSIRSDDVQSIIENIDYNGSAYTVVYKKV